MRDCPGAFFHGRDLRGEVEELEDKLKQERAKLEKAVELLREAPTDCWHDGNTLTRPSPVCWNCKRKAFLTPKETP